MTKTNAPDFALTPEIGYRHFAFYHHILEHTALGVPFTVSRRLKTERREVALLVNNGHCLMLDVTNEQEQVTMERRERYAGYDEGGRALRKEIG